MAGPSKKARGKHRLDKYYHLAKEQGYRSRAAFKLIQLNKKHGFLNDARAVLDLCAAPGGWLQVCAKHMPLSSRIIGVDLDAIKPIRGVTTLVEDITTQKCRDRLRKESGGSLFDVVLHDGAPNVGGAFASESYTQSALVLDACKLACEFLRPKGTFVTKVFRSRDYTALLFAFKQLFQRVDATKPQASRNTSAEIFVVCMGYKAPGKVDPRLLDHRVLFADLQEAPKLMGPDALLKSVAKKQRHRVGYDENTSLMHKPLSAAAFVLAKDPVPMLAQYTVINIDGPESIVMPKKGGTEDDEADEPEDEDDEALEPAEVAELIRNHEGTDAEVRGLCKDLQVLGRSEFKLLLKWRLKVKKALDAKIKELNSASGKEDEGKGEAGPAQSEEEELTPEERLLREMDELRQKIDKNAKKHRKKRRELKKKAKLRLAAMALTAGIGEELDPEEEKLFSLETIKGARALQAAGEVSALDEDELGNTLDAPDSDEEMVSSEEDDSDADSDDDRLRYEAMVEDYIDNAYQNYLERKSLRAAKEVEQRKRKRLGDEGEAAGYDAAADLEGLPEGRGGSESESEDEAGGGLLVDLDDPENAAWKKSGKAAAQQWFAQDVFQDEDLLDDDEPASKKATKAHKRSREDASLDGSDADIDEDDDEDVEDDDDSDDDMDASGDESPVPGIGVRMPGKGEAEGKRDGVNGHQGRSAGLQEAASSDEADSDDDEAAAIQRMKDPASRKAAAAEKRAAEAASLGVVPQDKIRDPDDSDSTDTEGEFEAMDEHAKAEIRAMARRWMKSRKNQLSILDAAYNRYTFNDEGLPKWFRDDEQKHMRPMTPATREEIEAERELLRAIDARPMKKIAEAKARKKRRVAQKMQEARNKAESIVDNEDMSIGRKAKEIEKLYARAKAHGRDKKSAPKKSKLSRSQRIKSSKKGPPLDRRMIADKMKGRARKITKAKRQASGQRGKRR